MALVASKSLMMSPAHGESSPEVSVLAAQEYPFRACLLAKSAPFGLVLDDILNPLSNQTCSTGDENSYIVSAAQSLA